MSPAAGRWNGPGGCREVLALGAPLMISMGGNTLMQFTDRMFLSWHSLDELAAAVPAGIASFLWLSLFMGVASCSGVLAAQYHGACRPERVGPAIWAGIWFSLAAGILLAGLAELSGPIFDFAGHPQPVRGLEAEYYRILTLFAGFPVLATALSGYYSGLGRTVPVMAVNVAGAVLNIPLDYALIFGKMGAPELGIRGAAYATVTGSILTCAIFALLLLAPEAEARHKIRSGWRPEPEMLRRLLRIGVPSGVQFFLDTLAITGFTLLVGRIGIVELTATNITFSINSLSYLPIVGLSNALSVLVGQSQGRGRPDISRRATANGLLLAFCWLGAVALAFVFVPGPLLDLFASSTAAAPGAPAFGQVRAMGVVLLRYVACYSLLDAFSMVNFGALKGAGDTRFLMLAMAAASFGVLLLPTWIVVAAGIGGIHGPWIALTAYIAFLALCFALRFRSGKWQKIRVIETPATDR